MERKKNEEIKRHINISGLIPIYTIHPPTVTMCTKFQLCTPHSSWEKCDENLDWELERKKNKEIKGWISSSTLTVVYTIVHMCTKFQLYRHHSSWEKCDENFIWKCCRITEWQNHRMTEGQGKSSIAPFQSGSIKTNKQWTENPLK